MLRFAFNYKNIILCIFIAILIVIALYKLLWLSIGIVILIGSYKFFTYSISSLRIDLLRKLLKALLIFTYVFVISICAKLFVIDVYHIPSVSMENTLYTNDVILVNKLIYGPKLPNSSSEISWIRLVLPKDGETGTVNTQSKIYKRASGISRIKQGDVLVYQLTSTYFVVKRCVAVPGDTLVVVDGEIYTNSVKYISPEAVKNNYKLSFKNKDALFNLLDSLVEVGKIITPNLPLKYLVGAFTSMEIEQLSKNPQISLSKVIDSFAERKEIFAIPQNAHWTYDNMGPLIVPAKGMMVKLTPKNVAVYKSIIKKFEGIKLEERQNKCYLDGKISSVYTFKQDYYFAMGDNRKEALDSRYTGFIPEENIVGKSACILFSNYGNQFRWNRIMKSIQ